MCGYRIILSLSACQAGCQNRYRSVFASWTSVAGGAERLNLLANWFPNSQFIGIDLSEEAIKIARVEADRQGNKNVSFIARDLSRFDQQAQPSAFDFITTFDAVHDRASPRNVLRGSRVSLRCSA